MAHDLLIRCTFRTAARAHWRHHCTRVSAPANDPNHFKAFRHDGASISQGR